MEIVSIKTEYIKLDQFIKWSGTGGSGSDAKFMISEGMVQVNGEIETRRGRKLRSGDIVKVGGKEYKLDRLEQ